jgi:Xaa-Pro aminopeptidase
MYLAVDWCRRVDFDRMREQRVKRLTGIMKEKSVDGIFSLKHQNVRYITGLRPLWFPIVRMRDAALLRSDGRRIAYPASGDAPHRKATMYWMNPDDIRPMPALEDPVIIRKFIPELQRAFDAFELTHARVGLDATIEPLRRALVETFPRVEWVDAEECLSEAKLIKNEEEIEVFRQACAAVDIGFVAAIQAVAPGRRECEILGEAMRMLYAQGMEIPQCGSIIASGENTVPLARFAGDRAVREGDVVFMDFGGCFNGMFAEFTRTVACGRPNAAQRRIYRAVMDVLNAVTDAMKPGRTSADVWAAAWAEYQKTGLAEYAIPSSLGHSIGVGGWEPPNLGNPAVTGKEFTLRPGMVFSVEPTLLVPDVPGGGGIRVEDEVLITETGCEVLSRARYDEALGS